MTRVFVDTNYWIAVISPQDQWHFTANEARIRLAAAQFVTTESVLIEMLNYFAPLRGRTLATETARDILEDELIEVVPHTHDAFLAGLALYEARSDKGYSLTDCISMNTMRERGIARVLTHDHHFTQEGFTILL